MLPPFNVVTAFRANLDISGADFDPNGLGFATNELAQTRVNGKVVLFSLEPHGTVVDLPEFGNAISFVP